MGPDPCRPRYSYLLPKIHKALETWTIPFEVPPGQPIVSDCNSCSYNISILLIILSFLCLRCMIVISRTHMIFFKKFPTFLFSLSLPLMLRAFILILIPLLESMLLETLFFFTQIPHVLIISFYSSWKFASHTMTFSSMTKFISRRMTQPWVNDLLQLMPTFLWVTIFFYRFLDNIVGAWPYSQEQFTEFIHILGP